MALLLKIHEDAHEEYINAYGWYEKEQEGLGAKFMNAVEKRIQRILEHPEYYGRAHGAYRQVKVVGFPYTIVYRFFPKRKIVHMSSIHHNSRHPKTKFRKEK